MTGLVLLLCVILFAIGITAFNKGWEVIGKENYCRCSTLRTTIFVIMIIIGILGLLMGGIGIGSSYVSQKSFPAEYSAIKLTIKNTEINDSYIERAALIHKVIEVNQYLASVRYWNGCAYGIFDWAYPDEVVKLPMLKAAYE